MRARHKQRANVVCGAIVAILVVTLSAIRVWDLPRHEMCNSQAQLQLAIALKRRAALSELMRAVCKANMEAYVVRH